MQINSTNIAAGKLQPRVASTRLLTRSALSETLNRALDERRLLVLAAPPGYGKTTLLAGWVYANGPAAYYRLDGADTSASHLLLGLSASLARGYDLPAFSALAAAEPLARGDYATALASLLAAVEQIPGRVVLMLDDYQHLLAAAGPRGECSGSDLLAMLLRLAPANLRVLFSGWGLLRLPDLASGYLSGATLQLGAAELAYSRDELASLLALRAISLPAEQLALLHSATGGWPAAVDTVLQVLAEAKMKTMSDISLESAVALAAPRLSSWLSAALLPTLRTFDLQFLLAVAPLPFLQDSLCDFALGRSDSALRLFELYSAGLLAWQIWQRSVDGVVTLRYGLHSLLRRALGLQQADAAALDVTVGRVGEWCVKNGEWSAAATLFLDAGQPEHAADALEQAARASLPAPLSAELRALAERLPRGLAVRLLMPPLRVQTLGGFAVSRQGVAIADTEWRRSKVKSLLKLLLANAGGRLSREMILDALWEHLPPEAALNNFNATLSALRHVLEPDLSGGRSSQFILYQDGYYWANLNANWWIDVVAFERSIAESKALRRASAAETMRQGQIDPRAARSLETAVEIYGGDFLPQDLYEDWPISRRERGRDLYLDALLTLSYYARDRGKLELAVEYAQRVTEREPYRESVHALLMSLYASLGNRGAAMKQFQLCARALLAEFGALPSQQTIELYNLISAAPQLPQADGGEFVAAWASEL